MKRRHLKHSYFVTQIAALVAVLQLAVFLPQGWSQSDKDAKDKTATTIASETFRLNLKKKEGLFSGSVKVDGVSFTLTSDELVVFFGEDNTIQRMLAKGHVSIHHGDKIAQSIEAEYVVKDKKLVLSGTPIVIQNEQKLSGETITIFPDEDKMEVKGRSTLQFYMN